MNLLSFWENKKVFLTGHTGFKGSWLCIWLNAIGAEVTGYALDPPSEPSLYEIANIEKIVQSVNADVRDFETLNEALSQSKAEIVVHMAAQPIVRESYLHPAETYEVNVMGTVNLLEAVRRCPSVRAVINVTTDKVYDNQEWVWGYRENDRLGGNDAYSSSKSCSELVTASYERSFFSSDTGRQPHTAVATVRSGNVIGGGDWAKHRLVPDCINALLRNKHVLIRNPKSVRPWQHVLEPLDGYIKLARRLYEGGYEYAGAWNFGPEDAHEVEWVVKKLCKKWEKKAGYRLADEHGFHEASFLKLDCSKAKSLLSWQPRWKLDTAIDKIVSWTRAYSAGDDMRVICENQILDYANSF
jgi:CDP-glucose 4,6-dehydratase